MVFLVICVSCVNCHVCTLQPYGDLSGPPGSLVCCDLLCFFEYCIVFHVLFCLCLVVLWSPAWKGLASGLSCIWCFLVILSFSHLISWVRCGA